MNNLSQECIEQIEKMADEYRLKWEEPRNTWHYAKGINAALSNKQLLQSAGLMSVDEAKKMATQEYWRGWKDYGESL